MQMPCRSLQNSKTFNLRITILVNSSLCDIFYLVTNDFDNERNGITGKMHFHVIL